MGAIERFPAITAPMPAVARILARYDRAQLAAFIEIAIDLADTIDGDPEAETDDHGELDDHAEEDDPAGQCDEDEINTYAKRTGPWYRSDGPGCPISDPGEWP